MARVPITVMGWRCERCSHEWIPKDYDTEPAVCPKCKSPYWERPRKNGKTAHGKSSRKAGRAWDREIAEQERKKEAGEDQ